MADYLNISMFEVGNLNILDYRYFLREAFIYNSSKTESGREYLKNAKRLEITDIDRVGLRNTFGSNHQ